VKFIDHQDEKITTKESSLLTGKPQVIKGDILITRTPDPFFFVLFFRILLTDSCHTESLRNKQTFTVFPFGWPEPYMMT